MACEGMKERKKRICDRKGEICPEGVQGCINLVYNNQSIFLSRHCYHPTKKKVQIFYLRFNAKKSGGVIYKNDAR